MPRLSALCAWIGVAGLLAGCADLLPRAQSEVRSPWRSFDEAKAAVERIEPGRTTLEELRALGIDPYTSPNTQLLTYSDITLRFPVNFSNDHLDPGLRECLQAGKECTGYYINVREVRRDRVGNFWKDALGFRREVEVTGWSFNSLVLLVGDRVVYTLYGGQPHVSEHEETRHPLGPAQDFGGALPLRDVIK